MRERGKFLRLFIGQVSAGKTRHLIPEIGDLRKWGRKKIAVVKPTTDTWNGPNQLKSKSGATDNTAYELPPEDPWMLIDILREQESAMGTRFDIVAFDEVQFFPMDSGFFQLIEYLLENGYDILAAGLPADFRGEPFGSTLSLTVFAEDRCTWLHAYCTKCGDVALFSQRLLNGEPVPYNSRQIQVGGSETYEPRCAKHFELPGRPPPFKSRTTPGKIP